MQKEQLLGRTFGRLKVVAESTPAKGRAVWECQCECGTVKLVRAAKLKDGGVKSCGCLRSDTSRSNATCNLSGGYKGYRKYKSVEDILANTTTNGECMEWNSALHSNGYAKVGKTATFLSPLLHREVFRMVHGYTPKVVMHTCDNPKCINPKHLAGGTQKDNIQDMHRKGRSANQQLTNVRTKETK